MPRQSSSLLITNIFIIVCLSIKDLLYVFSWEFTVFSNDRGCEIFFFFKPKSNLLKKIMKKYTQHCVTIVCFSNNVAIKCKKATCSTKTRKFTFMKWLTKLCSNTKYHTFRHINDCMPQIF